MHRMKNQDGFIFIGQVLSNCEDGLFDYMLKHEICLC